MSIKQLLRPRQLSDSGLAHYVVPLLIVLAIAIGGTYALVGSHAATPKPRIASVLHIAYQSGVGHAEGKKWCADIIVGMHVVTSGNVDKVRVEFAGFSATDLLYRGSNKWGTTVAPDGKANFANDANLTNTGYYKFNKCASRKGGSVSAGKATITAVYGQNTATKKLTFRSVKLN